MKEYLGFVSLGFFLGGDVGREMAQQFRMRITFTELEFDF